MSDGEMDKPVTRREMREECLVTRREMREMREEFLVMRGEMREELAEIGHELRTDLVGEMERIAKSLYEQFAGLLKASLEPVADASRQLADHGQRLDAIEAEDLPSRMLRVEAKVLPPTRAGRRKAGGR